jgi:hypothetical protein
MHAAKQKAKANPHIILPKNKIAIHNSQVKKKRNRPISAEPTQPPTHHKRNPAKSKPKKQSQPATQVKKEKKEKNLYHLISSSSRSINPTVQ